MNKMHNPAHPGEILKDGWLDALHISITQAAQDIGISRKHLSNIIHGSVSITPDIAKRLEAYTGNDAEFWLRLQNARDLWNLRDVTYEIKRVA
jgi:antitoxin HigA-1